MEYEAKVSQGSGIDDVDRKLIKRMSSFYSVRHISRLIGVSPITVKKYESMEVAEKKQEDAIH